VQGTFLAQAPIIATSTKTGRGLDELREKLMEVARGIEAKPVEDIFRLPVDRVFTIKGMGTVVTGTVWSGAIELDQMVTVQPIGKSARVKGIQVHSESRGRAQAGSRVALGLSGIARNEIERGATVLTDASWEPTMMIDAFLSHLSHGSKHLRNRTRIRFHLATQEVMGRVVLLEGRELGGGESGFVQLRLEKPVIARRGDRFVIRSYSPLTTIGGGVVLVPNARKRTSLDSREGRHLQALRGGSVKEMIESSVITADLFGLPKNRLPVDLGLGLGVIDPVLKGMIGDGEVIELKEFLFHRSVFDRMSGNVMKGLEAYHREYPLHEGVKREELRHRIGSAFSADLLDGVLNELIKRGRIQVSGGEVRLSSHQIVFGEGVDALAEEILSLLAAEPLAPPDVSKIASALGAQRGRVVELLSALQRTGKVIKLDDSLWLAAEGIRIARERIVGYLTENEKGTASEFRGVLNVSRKFAIPILEYMDRSGVTYRKGDHRYLKGQ
jgi:selenocysteine-specific elongation factor